MKIPFSKTVKQAPKLGVKKLFYLFIFDILDFAFKRLRRFPRGVALIETCTKHKMLVRLGSNVKIDNDIHRNLFQCKIREPYLTAFLFSSKILKKGDVVLDIGSNIGYYVLIEAGLVGKEGLVYAVEPVEENARWLGANIALNGYKNVKIFNIAFGDYNGKISINIAEASNLSSVTKNSGVKYLRKDEVEVRTVDDFLADKRNPKLIRMDVEGYEYEILKGMRQTLERVKPLSVFVELHCFMLSKKEIREIVQMFRDNSFKIRFMASCPITPEPTFLTVLRKKLE
ncbi:MAG: FkbM family methyltransferase [Candidatus Bathyarchaeales archaeon]